MIVSLRNKDGDLILLINTETQMVTTVDPLTRIAIPYNVYFEHMEKFAIELIKATGHKLDPKEI